MPWSTRAIIFIAFAIQMAPVSGEFAQSAARPADRLLMSDGRLMALWMGSPVAKSTLCAIGPTRPGATSAGASRPTTREPCVVQRPRPHSSGPALLPIPPPALG